MTDHRTPEPEPLFLDRGAVPNGWTGGQYSLYRALLAVGFLFVILFVAPVPDSCTPRELAWWEAPLEMGVELRIALGLLAVLIAVGWLDRAAALIAALFVASVAIDYQWRVYLILLIAHASSRGRPFGSLAAVGRVDPGGGWRRADWNLALACTPTLWWMSASLVVVFTRLFHLDVPVSAPAILLTLCLVFLLTKSAFFQRAFWLFWLLYGSAALWTSFFLDDGPSVMLFTLFVMTVAAFDPPLIPRRRSEEPEVLYYDGDCGFCHRAVRFLLAEDRGGKGFRFAALQSDHFAEHVSEAERAGLADSVLVRTADGRLLQRSEAAVHVLLALGGLWRVIGTLLWTIPRPLRDFAYDGVARVRKRLFRAPEGLCPLIPAELGARFLA